MFIKISIYFDQFSKLYDINGLKIQTLFLSINTTKCSHVRKQLNRETRRHYVIEIIISYPLSGMPSTSNNNLRVCLVRWFLGDFSRVVARGYIQKWRDTKTLILVWWWAETLSKWNEMLQSMIKLTTHRFVSINGT